MAKLCIKKEINVSQGTIDKRKAKLIIWFYYKGSVVNDFISGIDYDKFNNEINFAISSIDNKYVDDILGRGTIENICYFLLYQLKETEVQTINIIENDKYSISINKDEVDIGCYEYILPFKIGASKLVRGQYQDAISFFSKSFKINNSFFLAKNALGRCYFKMKEYTKGIEVFSYIINNDPNHSEAYRNRANCYLYLKKYEKMTSDFNNSVRINPNSALTINNRGFGYQQLGEYKLALKDHEKAISINSMYAEAYFDRGEAYKQLGFIEKSKSDFKKYNELLKRINLVNIEFDKIYCSSL